MKNLKQWPLFIILCVILTQLSTGCGGSNATPPDDDDEVVTHTVGGTVTGLDGTLVLQNNGGDDLTITQDGSFTFSTALSDAAAYAVTIFSKSSLQNCSAENTSGTIAAADVTDVSITCSNKTWTFPSGLTDFFSPAGTSVDSFDVAMNGAVGNALIAWNQDDGVNWQIFMSEYRDGAWNHPENLDDNISPPFPDAEYARVAINENGDAIIVWDQFIGTEYRVFMSEYRNGAWTHPADENDCISPKGTTAYYPDVAMNDNGDAIVAWEQYDDAAVNAAWRVYMSEYRNGSWTHPSITEPISPPEEDADEPTLAMDNNGNVIIVWVEDVGIDERLFMSEYRDGAWKHPADLSEHISPVGSNVAGLGAVAMGDNGDAIIAWEQDDDAVVNPAWQIYKSEYRNGSWTHPSSLADNISPDGYNATTPKVAMDASGNAIAVWRQDNGSNNAVFKYEYRNGSWAPAVGITDFISFAGSDAEDPDVAMDDNGSAIIAWHQKDTNLEEMIYKSEYRNGAWIDPTSLDDHISPSGTDTTSPRVGIVMDPNGDAMIVWIQDNGTNNSIYKAEFR